ncbi:hypothetical protein [Reyranella sp.]|uniref:hypothetical protein n=1 Tax=Reyranella sp. TaxID=1929291 RepID=UPI003F6EF85C
MSMGKMGRDPEFGSVLLRLMMVVNDCAIAGETAEMWKSEDSELRRKKREEAFRYFVELQIAHIYEGLKIIREIQASKRLKRFVQECDGPTQREFDTLVAFLVDPKYEKIVGRVRNNLAFHYDAKLTERALTQYCEKYAEGIGAISMGSKPFDWMFEPGAFINERVAVRDVFDVPEGADITEKTDKLMIELQGILNTFMQFAGHFVWKHTA